jgi:rhamnosyltransferase
MVTTGDPHDDPGEGSGRRSPTVNIVLSTFNGEKYLAEQLDSVLRQTHVDWRLLVRDDGSTDGTVALIRRYASGDVRIRFVNDGEPALNLGFVASFFALTKLERADFVVFCDQDDVWLPTKLELLLAEAAKHDNDVPVLYYSRWQAVDEHLDAIPGIGDRQDLFATTRLREQLTTNGVLGATSMINARLADAWQDCEGLRSHDAFLGLTAAALGELVYVRETTLLYRQHDGNRFGAHRLSPHQRTIRGRADQFWTYYVAQKKRDARRVLEITGAEIPPDRQRALTDFVLMNTYPLAKRVLLVARYRYVQKSRRGALKLWVLLASNYGNPDGRSAPAAASTPASPIGV